MHSCIHPSVHPSIHPSIHPCILPSTCKYHLHTYIHTYIHTIIPTYLQTNMQCPCTYVITYTCTHIQSTQNQHTQLTRLSMSFLHCLHQTFRDTFIHTCHKNTCLHTYKHSVHAYTSTCACTCDRHITYATYIQHIHDDVQCIHSLHTLHALHTDPYTVICHYKQHIRCNA